MLRRSRRLWTAAWALTLGALVMGCSMRGRMDFEASLLAPLNRAQSAKDQRAASEAEAAQLLSDRGLLTICEGKIEKAEAQLVYLGIKPEEARRRMLAAQVAAKAAKGVAQ